MWILTWSSLLLFADGEANDPSNSHWVYNSKFRCEAQLTVISRNNPLARWKGDVLITEAKDEWNRTYINYWSCNYGNKG